MKKAKVFVDGILAGELQEIEKGKRYRFVYLQDYQGASISLEMPTFKEVYEYDRFPLFLKDYCLKELCLRLY